jgi:hypothetical protein
VREALASGLIIEAGDQLGFRHDLIREAIESGLPSPVQRSLQRRALDVMLDFGAVSSDVATLVMQVARPVTCKQSICCGGQAWRSGELHRRLRRR